MPRLPAPFKMFFIAVWCNGSTADFGSACIGSTPVAVTIMVGVAQLVERQIVVLKVVGSSPIIHPKNADVVKLVVHSSLRNWWQKCRAGSMPVIRTHLCIIMQIL